MCSLNSVDFCLDLGVHFTPPEILHGYDAIIPGAAERILRMAEEDALHRREIKKAAIFQTLRK